MEILNNIWSLLTTENEFVTSLVVLPLYFVETYLSLYTFSILLKMELSKNQKFIYVITISLVIISTNFFVNEPFNVIINYVIVFLLLFVGYKQSFLKSILAIIIPFAIFGVVNTLILNPFLKILNITSNTLTVIPIYQIALYYCCY